MARDHAVIGWKQEFVAMSRDGGNWIATSLGVVAVTNDDLFRL
jgi:hypothetical protein